MNLSDDFERRSQLHQFPFFPTTSRDNLVFLLFLQLRQYAAPDCHPTLFQISAAYRTLESECRNRRQNVDHAQARSRSIAAEIGFAAPHVSSPAGPLLSISLPILS